MTDLRWYQREAIDATWEWMRNHRGKSPLIVLPTGSGKSIVLGAMFREILDTWEGQRLLVVSHVREIVQQDADALRLFLPQVGIMCAGLDSFEGRPDVVSASVQTAINRVDQLGFRHICLVDEAHLVPARDSSMYQKLFAELRRINPDMVVIGMTATPYRLDSGCLVEGRHKIFDGISYTASIERLIEDRYLCPLIAKRVDSVIDVSRIGTRGGEFKLDELESEALLTVTKAVDEIVTWGADRGKWLVFGSGVEHSQMVAEAIRAKGIDAEEIYGDTPARKRERILRRHRDGDLRCLVNNTVLTTGFDNPDIDLIACLRPTQSPGLWVQMAGRGFRIAPGKQDCLILDFGENTARHGPLNMIEPPRKTGNEGDGTAPVKACPKCDTLVFAGARTCPSCGHEFPPPEVKHEEQASTEALIAGRPQVTQRITVDAFELREHPAKPGKPPTVRACYFTGGAHWPTISEWICPEHKGYPRTKFLSWWTLRSKKPELPPPRTVQETIARQSELRYPYAVIAIEDGSYKRIEAHIWEQTQPCSECEHLISGGEPWCGVWGDTIPERIRPVGCDRWERRDEFAELPF